MQSDQIVTFVRTVPVFHFLEDEHLQALASHVQVRDISPHEVLLRQGEEGSELFIVVQGEAAAIASEASVDIERELRRFYPGDYFGMVNVLTREQSASTVKTLTDAKFLVITRDAINGLFETSSSFAQAVCRSLASFLRENIVKIPAIPFERLEAYPNLRETASLLPTRISQYCQALVVDRDVDRVKVALVNPSDKRAREFIRDVLKQFEVEYIAISEEDFNRHAPLALEVKNTAVEEEAEVELAFLDPNGQRAPIAETDEHDVLAKALNAGIRAGVSDIHIEPSINGGRIRFRLDGRMVSFRDDIGAPSMRQLISRLKVMANMDITRTRQPQDGRFTIIANDQPVEFRESVMPCQGGEKTVLRVAHAANASSLNGLFVSDAVAQFAEDIFMQPSGLVLVTGPTGSGKTTSLYAALHMLNAEKATSNIVTVEDPVEYGLDFATQTQVDNDQGLDFARVLRAMLRQDPDIILVGEIRDRESAAIAVEAAATGHLVLSSLHTHSALETLARLRNLDVPAYMLADALKGIISQKLLPALHPAYREPIDSKDADVERLQKRGIFGNDEVPRLYRGREDAGGPMGGESGRIALFEMLAISDEMSDLIETEASRAEIEQHLTGAHYCSFEQYARILLEKGYVAPSHVERALPRKPELLLN